MVSCKKCVNYHTSSCCCNEEKRIILIEDYDVDCFQSIEDKMLCDIMCPINDED